MSDRDKAMEVTPSDEARNPLVVSAEVQRRVHRVLRAELESLRAENSELRARLALIESRINWIFGREG
jgi:hypothetical protein